VPYVAVVEVVVGILDDVLQTNTDSDPTDELLDFYTPLNYFS